MSKYRDKELKLTIESLEYIKNDLIPSTIAEVNNIISDNSEVNDGVHTIDLIQFYVQLLSDKLNLESKKIKEILKNKEEIK